MLTKIVHTFGKGGLDSNKYVFDLITDLPPGFAEKKLPSSEVVSQLLQRDEICVIFDPNTQNDVYRWQLLRHLGMPEDTMGFKLSPRDILPFISATDCDFYITTTDGLLLTVGCHEDHLSNGERIMWCPAMIEPKK